MKVVIVIDSFKGSLTSVQAGFAVADGIKKAIPNAETLVCPIADGGEGTTSAVVTATGGKIYKLKVCGPLGEQVDAEYGVTPNGTVVVETATAAGLTLIEREKRNPLETTTYGLGEIILDAVKKGYRDFIVGLGGSATNDGGVGMLQALGFEFLDGDGKQIPLGAEGLASLKEIRKENALPALKDCRFQIACDVKNPLCGESGCSAVYAPQKGGTKESIRLMDGWLLNYADLTKKTLGVDFKNVEGVGAAGGLGFAFCAYLNGALRSGIELIANVAGLEEKISAAEVVVTGEGRLDGQTGMGKAPVGIAKIAKNYALPVVAFSGAVTKDAGACNEVGIDAFFPILREPCVLERAMQTDYAYENLSRTAEQAFRLVAAFWKKN
ncbi:MAG: glycerate kinase [Clostridiales bacterium]|nr:glycerate kinase [Clostridiales bacterium]